MAAIDLSVDLGEGCNTDEAPLALVSSASIAYGWHVGDINTMRQTVGQALCQDAPIGAHSSFPDRENFGRTRIHLQPDEIYAGALLQIGGLSAIIHTQGGRLVHVETYGTPYNQVSHDRPLVMAIVYAIRDFDPSLVVFGLTGDELAKAMREFGLQAREEVFANHDYNADDSLIERGTPGALIGSEDAALDRTPTMVREQRVKAINGT